MTPKFKVLLIQLPIPEFKTQKHWGNSPLAAGYLKAAAFTAGLLDKVDIEILNEDDTNLSADARLIDLVASKAPDVVGWSLFLWNAKRSLYLSSEIKKRCPDSKIVVGGPEVSAETHYLLQHPAVDCGCFGEGETIFVEILKSFFFGTPDLAKLSGIFYKKNQKTVVNPGKNYVENHDQIRSPFLLDYINVKNHPMISYETNRGCPFHCAYCQTATLPFRYFGAERICADIDYFVKQKVQKVRLTDSNVALHPEFVPLFTQIKDIVSNQDIRFSGFAYAEHLTEEKVKLLKACNFTFLEVGLQTIHQETLKILRRPRLNKASFLHGLKLLEAYDITYHVDTIIGLPGESYSDYKETIDFLNDHNVKYIQAFPLMIMPGTQLNVMAETLGLKHQKRPPYYLIETAAIRNKEIEEAKKRFQRIPAQQSDVNYTFLSHLNGLIFGIDVSDEQKVASLSEMNGFNKLIIDMKNRQDGVGNDSIDANKIDLESIPETTVNMPFTAWFKMESFENEIPLIQSFLNRVVSANPFILINLIIESEDPFLPENMDQLTASLPFMESRQKINHTEEPYLKQYIVLPGTVVQAQKQTNGMQTLFKRSPWNTSAEIVYAVDIPKDRTAEDAIAWINQICKMTNDPKLLVRFEDQCDTITVLKILDLLKNKKRENIFFINSAVYYAMDLLRMEKPWDTLASDQVLQIPPSYNALTYDTMGQSWVQTLPQLLKQMKHIGFQMAFRKKFSES
ncbi:B12-binding domain-containing radical SAM protein [Desulfobacter latus]|uniref:B12-binding domain-containing radical SAM protein n=1 Tax=Desulfobacter latus TaxID=2292 RepID=A0A850T2J3_9BACT|nr:radical SAM protein [Desulfobacter latus]NWH03402.1 B12-binding domain-containing radical SAM protein [Desulfobacter latus]